MNPPGMFPGRLSLRKPLLLFFPFSRCCCCSPLLLFVVFLLLWLLLLLSLLLLLLSLLLLRSGQRWRSDGLGDLLTSHLIDSPGAIPGLVTVAGPRSIHHLTCVVLLVVVIVTTVSAVSLHRGSNHNTLRQVPLWLEPHHISSVFDNFYLPIGVDVAVLALDGPVSKPGLQLEGSVRGLVPVSV